MPWTQGKPLMGAERRARLFVDAWARADGATPVGGAWWMSGRAIESLARRLTDLFAGQALPPPVPSGESEARKRLAGGTIAIGTPRDVSRDCRGDPDLRAPECIAYALCLDHTLRQGWIEFTCRGCAGPGVLASHQRLAPGEAPKEDITRKPNPHQTHSDGTSWG